MGGCDKADLSQRVICCAGKVQVIILAGIFMVSAFATGGLLYWSIEAFKKSLNELAVKRNEKMPEGLDYLYSTLALSALMLLSALCLFTMLKLSQKLLLIICIIWPLLSSAIPGLLIYLAYMAYDAVKKELETGRPTGLTTTGTFNALQFYVPYIVVGGGGIYILCSIYCIVLLICLGCCQRAGAGKEVDLYDLESESRDEPEESTKSHISIE